MIEDYESIHEVNSKLDFFEGRLFHSLDVIEKEISGIFSKFDVGFKADFTEDDEEYVYKLEAANDMPTDFYLYVLIEKELIGFVVYAQIIDEEELDNIDMFLDYTDGERGTSDYLLRVRRSADD